ncbi:hypothetical protein [Aureimonas sp. D3]|uniref:hypothetical protein n=1 Tax=Aureimonas sp. D3 TaxID=1638164 RepID=UPI000782BD1C|nr:hypothetical protein [Aureimonas sp. D3]
MKLTLRQAAAEVGRSKSTLLRSIQSGRLSAERQDDGGYLIHPAELFRVYEPRTDAVTHDAPPEIVSENATLKAQLEAVQEVVRRLDAQIADMKEDREDLRKDRDHWRAQADAAQRFLTDERAKPPAPAPQQEPAPVAAPQLPDGRLARLMKAWKG